MHPSNQYLCPGVDVCVTSTRFSNRQLSDLIFKSLCDLHSLTLHKPFQHHLSNRIFQCGWVCARVWGHADALIWCFWLWTSLGTILCTEGRLGRRTGKKVGGRQIQHPIADALVFLWVIKKRPTCICFTILQYLVCCFAKSHPLDSPLHNVSTRFTPVDCPSSEQIELHSSLLPLLPSLSYIITGFHDFLLWWIF